MCVSCVFVYDKDPISAMKTLRHEVIDFALTKFEELWRDLVLRFVAEFTEQRYKRKEVLVDRLVELRGG